MYFYFIKLVDLITATFRFRWDPEVALVDNLQSLSQKS